jgi:hypothetical protein
MIADTQNVSRETLPSTYAKFIDLDYVTLTGKTGESYERPFIALAEYTDERRRAGDKEWKQNRNGFKLLNIGSVAYGRRDDEWMVVAWGKATRRIFYRCAPYASNCTRIDLQVTMRYENYAGVEVQAMWETMKEVRLEGKPVGVVFITSDPGGDSLYIGSRSSSQMGRIYDKWEQSKHDPEFDRCIRYEVEYKKPLSKVVADLILDEDWGSRQIFENVLGWFQERGVIVDQFGTFREGAIQTPRETVSPEKSLAWLERQVKPTYQQLVFRGYEQEAQEALGISPKIIPPDWTDQEMEF